MKSLLSPVHYRIAKAILGFEQRKEPSFVSDLVTKLGYAAESSLTATLRIMERNGFLVIQGGGERGRARVVTLTAKARFALGSVAFRFWERSRLVLCKKPSRKLMRLSRRTTFSLPERETFSCAFEETR